MEPDCVFCRILAGDEPASLVHEDDVSIAFLSLHQTRPGETVVIPREHVDHFTDLADDVAAHVMIAAQRIGRALLSHLDTERIGYVVHGYGVPHAHLIVVPQEDPTDITSARMLRIEDGKAVFTMDVLRKSGRGELDDLAARIRTWIG